MQIPTQVTRRAFLRATLGTAAFSQPAAARPNIVFLMADDLGYADLSCYGRREYRTPAIDSIATQGTKFLQAYANSSVCSATRTALMTGRYQYRLRVGLEEPIRAVDEENGLPPGHPTLPSLLKKAGYGTTLIGKWHLGKPPHFGPLQSGYDHFWGFRGPYLDYFTHSNGPAGTGEADLWDDDKPIQQPGYMTDLLGDRAVQVIGEYAKAHRPFLLSVHFNAPHWPWEGPADEARAKTLRTMVDYDGGSQSIYAAMVTRMDANVQKILRALDRAGLARNTIVVFTSDNGGERFSDNWPFSGRKSELLEGGLRIPAVVRWPGHIKPGSTTQQAAITMDWVPTFLAAADAAPDPAYPLDGMNLLPAITQNAPPEPRKLYWRYRFNQQRAFRDGDRKWLRINENDFLFNVVDDPLERANLSVHEPETHQRMAEQFAAWNQTMLPEIPTASSTTFFSNQLADHMGNRPPATGGKP